MRSIETIKKNILQIKGDERERRSVHREKVGALNLPSSGCAMCYTGKIKLFPVYLYDKWGCFSTETEVCLSCYCANSNKIKRRGQCED